MKQDWMIHRQTVQQVDGQRRWDLIYQSLLRWSDEKIIHLNIQEAENESSNLHTSIDTTSDLNSDDRATN